MTGRVWPGPPSPAHQVSRGPSPRRSLSCRFCRADPFIHHQLFSVSFASPRADTCICQATSAEERPHTIVNCKCLQYASHDSLPSSHFAGVYRHCLGGQLYCQATGVGDQGKSHRSFVFQVLDLRPDISFSRRTSPFFQRVRGTTVESLLSSATSS